MATLAPETIALARGGDKRALEQLLTAQRAQLERHALSLVDEDLRQLVHVSDLVRSTLLEALATMGRFDGDDEQDFERWMLAILEANVGSTQAAARTFGATGVTRRADGGAPALLSVVTDGPFGSAEVSISDELMVVARAMSRLPEIFQRTLLFGLTRCGTREQAAAALGRTPGATRVLLARARAALLLELDRQRDHGEELAESGERVRLVLEAVFLAEASGEKVALAELCDGDATLLERTIRLLDSEPELARAMASDDVLPEAASSEEAAAEEPRTVGEYQLLAPLGRGTRSTVYLARQRGRGAEVALKLLDPSALSEAARRIRLRYETELAASLRNAHIVPVFSAGESEGRPYVAMMRLSGPALDELTAPLGEDEIVRLGAAIARALEAAHAVGLVHRDVSPGNVILDDGVPHLVDFGLAPARPEEHETGQPDADRRAPELGQAAGPAIDGRIDVYGLGATLYELLAGRPPFGAPGERAPRLRRVSPRLAAIVQRALEPTPERRYASAAEMAADLQALHDGLPLPSGLRRPGTGAGRAFGRVLAVVALLLLAGLSTTFFGDGRAERRQAVTDELAAAELSLAGHDLPAATRHLEVAAALAGDDARVVGLAERLAAQQAVDSLLEALSEPPADVDRVHIDRLMRLVEHHHVLLHQPRLARLGLALAAWQTGRREAASAWLDEATDGWGATRAGRALRSLVHDEAELDLPPPSAIEPADEGLLVVLVQRALARPLDEQRAELGAILQRDGGHRRARALLAAALLADDQLEAARALLDGLVREQGTEPSVWRRLTLLHLRAGDVAPARAALSHRPRADWTPSDAVLHLRLVELEQGRSREGREELQRELADQRRRWPDAHALLRFEAEDLGWRRRRPQQALQRFEQALALPLTPTQRDVLRALQHELESEFLLSLSLPLAGLDGPERRAALLARGEVLLAELTAREARARVLATRGRLLFQLDRRSEALLSLGESIGLLPLHARTRVDMVTALVANVAAIPSGDERDYAVGLAREQLDQLLELVARGRVRIPLETHGELLDAAVRLAEHQGDLRALELLLPRDLLFHDTRARRELLQRARGAGAGLLQDD